MKKTSKPAPKAVKNAQDTWLTFTRFSTYATGLVVVILILMAAFLV